MISGNGGGVSRRSLKPRRSSRRSSRRGPAAIVALGTTGPSRRGPPGLAKLPALTAFASGRARAATVAASAILASGLSLPVCWRNGWCLTFLVPRGRNNFPGRVRFG